MIRIQQTYLQILIKVEHRRSREHVGGAKREKLVVV